jgi:hypothetical protein
MEEAHQWLFGLHVYFLSGGEYGRVESAAQNLYFPRYLADYEPNRQLSPEISMGGHK